MSDKMLCPGCDAYTSSVLIKVREEGEPCPYCGLSAAAILEITEVREKKADEELKERLAKALVERDHATVEAARLRRIIEDARRLFGCQYPYAPHTAPDEDWARA